MKITSRKRFLKLSRYILFRDVLHQTSSFFIGIIYIPISILINLYIFMKNILLVIYDFIKNLTFDILKVIFIFLTSLKGIFYDSIANPLKLRKTSDRNLRIIIRCFYKKYNSNIIYVAFNDVKKRMKHKE